MNNNAKHQRSFVNLKLRNIRYLSFVNANINPKDMVDFLIQNQRFWGGRFNTVIPVVDGKITDKYFALALATDPDYIFYFEGFDLQSIKQFFNPVEYMQVVFNDFTQIIGVEVEQLLSDDRGYSAIVSENYLYKAIPKLYNFYKLNFGFFHNPNIEMLRKFEKFEARDNNYEALNEILLFKNVCYTSQLSRINVSSKILISKTAPWLKFELIVADSKNQINDILYYWNKCQYIPVTQSQNFLFITDEELKLFLETNPTRDFFHALTKDNINVVSQSLKVERLKAICATLNDWQGHKNFSIGQNTSFPYKIDDHDIEYGDEIEVTRSLLGVSDTFQLPALSFGKQDINFGGWMLDIKLAIENDTGFNTIIELPCKSELTKLFTDQAGRINRQNNISLMVNRHNHEHSLFIADSTSIFKALLLKNHRQAHPIVKIDTSDDGKRFLSLLRLFKSDYTIIDYFYRNIFWLNVFRSSSIAQDGGKMKKSKSTYSIKDLLREIKNTCDDRGYKYDEEALLRQESEFKRDLAKLVAQNALFIGFKIKCDHCGSNSWYNLNELNNSIDCKGCQQKISLQIEPTPYYKVNDILINNLVSGSDNNKNIHGNYTVYMALSQIKSDSYRSFIHFPSQNYYKEGEASIASDIDIICLSDGKLIIGEAKNSVKEFTKKEFDCLIYLAKRIHPDVLLLAFNEGEETRLDDFISKLKKALEGQAISIETLKIRTPYFYSSDLTLEREMK